MADDRIFGTIIFSICMLTVIVFIDMFAMGVFDGDETTPTPTDDEKEKSDVTRI